MDKELKKKIINDIYGLRHELHQIPELAFNEIKTKKRIMDFLGQFDNLTVVDRGQWFYAFREGKDKDHAIAFRADFDAVEGKDGKAGHFCGHDGHSATLAGFGEYLSYIEPDRTVYMIFQPAEEIGRGAVICRQLLEEKNIDEIYGFHNIPGFEKGSCLILSGTFACASTGIEIKIKGTPSHAAYPEAGKNPAEVIAKLILMKDQIIGDGDRAEIAEDCKAEIAEDCKAEIAEDGRAESRNDRGLVKATVIGVDIGGQAYGVSAGSGALRLTVRAEKEEEFRRIVEEICQKARSMSAEAGMECTTELIEQFPATENHDKSIARLEKAAVAAGKKIIYPDEPFRWSEDFGYYLQTADGAFFGIGSGEDCPQLHTENYEFPDEVSETAIDIYEQMVPGQAVSGM